MVDSYFEGRVPEPPDREGLGRLPGPARALGAEFDRHIRAIELTDAVAALSEFVRHANRYLVEVAPWSLAKHPERRAELAASLYEALEALRILAVLASPVMPGAAARLWSQLGIAEPLEAQLVPKAATWGLIEPGTVIHRGQSLFPRLAS
jgi:methionyl-tRNA synthetase